MKTDLSLLENIEDFISNKANDEFEFQLGELGSMHAQSEDHFLSLASETFSVIEEKHEIYGDQIIDILNIEFDNNGYIIMGEELCLEELQTTLNEKFEQHEALSLLKSKPNFHLFNKNLINVVCFCYDEIKNIDFHNIRDENDYTEVILDALPTRMLSDFNELDETFNHVLNLLAEKEKENIKKSLNENKTYNYPHLFKRISHSIIGNMYYMYDGIDSKNILNVKNVSLFNLIKENDDFSILSQKINSFTIKNQENFLYNLIIEKTQKLFNPGTLHKNHFFKELSRMIKNEICKENKKKQIYNNSNFSNFKINIPDFFKNEDRVSDIFLEKVVEILNLKKRHSNLIKSQKDNFNIKEFNKIEDMFDKINELIEESKLKKYVKKIIGSYEHLKSEKNLSLIREIKDKNIDLKFIKGELSNIALMDSPEMLSHFLKSIINNEKQAMSISGLEHKIKNNNLNAEIVFKNTEDNQVAIIMHDLNTATHIAPPRWCITKSELHFNTYKGRGHNILFIDFNKDFDDPNHMIGISVQKDNSIRNIFDKNNNAVHDLSSIWNENLITNFKDSLEMKSLDEEIEKIKSRKMYTIDSKDIVYVINKAFPDKYDSSKDVLEKFVYRTIKFSKLSKKRIIDNIITFNNNTDPNINLLNMKEVQDIAQDINHPISFLNKNKKESNKIKQKQRPN